VTGDRGRFRVREGGPIGTTILRAELARAAALGQPIRLRVLLQNRAFGLYQRHGFEVTHETETHYLMQRLPTPIEPPE